jgi:serine/threonine-protein kinase
VDETSNMGPGAGTGTPAPPPGDSSDPTGTVLAGRYRIVGKLGEGAMGAVYIGEHLRIGRRDAIKVLRGGLAQDSDSLARFERGARHLSAIRHPNVCTLYDYGETEDGSPFLALELIEGESLKDLLDREGPLPPARAMAIARQIGAALQAAHSAGIVHRDLKPGNVMIERGQDGSDVVKVVDFDIAKGPGADRGEEVTQLGFVVGTPEYMSPEQLMGDKLDGRSDIYSLGLALFRMLTGSLPFRGGSTHEVMVQRLTTRPLTIEQVVASAAGVPGLQEVLDRALALERADRYATAAELVGDLDRLLGGQAPTAPPPPAVTPTAAAPPRAAQREMPETVLSPPIPRVATATGAPRRNLWWVAAALVIVGGGGTVLLLKGSGAPGETQGGADSGDPAATSTDSPAVAGPPAAVRTDSQTGVGASRGRASPQRGEATTTSTPGSANPSIVVADADVSDTLNRLFDRLPYGADGVAAGGARDTASAIWGKTGAPVDDRALAAYIVAESFVTLRDAAGCERWIQRALELRPGLSGIADLRTRCRGVRE